jgi:hypothetical protein
MLNTMPIITEEVRMAELEASKTRWPMGTTEPRQGIGEACTCINLGLIQSIQRYIRRYFNCSGFEERDMRKINFVEQLIVSQKPNDPDSASISH